MIIANPIYDTTFKLLMENTNVAKTMIGTIINCEVLTLVQTNTERTIINKETPSISVQRMDFVADIVTKEEGQHKVMIEVQKTRGDGDMYRFRRYLGSEYISSHLPIIVIYILGFDLEGVDSPAFMAYPEFRDIASQKQIEANVEFVKVLTHRAFFIQTKRIAPSDKTQLDQLLTLFEQPPKNIPDPTTKPLNISITEPPLKEIVDILAFVAGDKDLREELQNEHESMLFFEDTYGPFKKDIAQKAQIIEENTQKMKLIAEFMKQSGVPTEQIAEMTGLSIAEIEKL